MATADTGSTRIPVSQLDIPWERDLFLRSLVSELSSVLEDVVGLKEASGFISIVGQNMGNQMDLDYKRALEVSRLSRRQVADVLVDLKERIKGDFYIIEQNDDRIVLGNRACPFAEKVVGRSSMCMMTSNVFGVVASQSLGYAKVSLEETIAQGDPECRVVVYLKPDRESAAASGQEYFQSAT
ncbi:methanogen output domain 1-containing protein [Marinobacter salicampi]|uniref:methanogen output domain 1-containing protein n=1 Tax=Marinobacter salicampi TaxID=435907 RepID=UPI00140E92FB|nr:methanogen output domain 1-containing protein [Marinobacter salicampi]